MRRRFGSYRRHFAFEVVEHVARVLEERGRVGQRISQSQTLFDTAHGFSESGLIDCALSGERRAYDFGRSRLRAALRQNDFGNGFGSLLLLPLLLQTLRPTFLSLLRAFDDLKIVRFSLFSPRRSRQTFGDPRLLAGLFNLRVFRRRVEDLLAVPPNILLENLLWPFRRSARPLREVLVDTSLLERRFQRILGIP